MAPTTARAGPSTPSGKPSASHPKSTSGGPMRTPKHRSNSHATSTSSSSATAIPGVQKLKAALRQTRRLLAKEDLNADARVVAERKLKAQEAELAAAEIARTERTMATRYHKIKFFERQKVVRKITQTTRSLALDDQPKDKRKIMQKTMKELRVDLNYILHYPKTRKYISLFPPSARGVEEELADDVEQAKTDVERETLRAEIRRRMEAGELSAEPELELDGQTHSIAPLASSGTIAKDDLAMDVDENTNNDEDQVSTPASAPTSASKTSAKARVAPQATSTTSTKSKSKSKKPGKKERASRPKAETVSSLTPALDGDDFFAAD